MGKKQRRHEILMALLGAGSQIAQQVGNIAGQAISNKITEGRAAKRGLEAGEFATSETSNIQKTSIVGAHGLPILFSAADKKKAIEEVKKEAKENRIEKLYGEEISTASYAKIAFDKVQAEKDFKADYFSNDTRSVKKLLEKKLRDAIKENNKERVEYLKKQIKHGNLMAKVVDKDIDSLSEDEKKEYEKYKLAEGPQARFDEIRAAAKVANDKDKATAQELYLLKAERAHNESEKIKVLESMAISGARGGGLYKKQEEQISKVKLARELLKDTKRGEGRKIAARQEYRSEKDKLKDIFEETKNIKQEKDFGGRTRLGAARDYLLKGTLNKIQGAKEAERDEETKKLVFKERLAEFKAKAGNRKNLMDVSKNNMYKAKMSIVYGNVTILEASTRAAIPGWTLISLYMYDVPDALHKPTGFTDENMDRLDQDLGTKFGTGVPLSPGYR